MVGSGVLTQKSNCHCQHVSILGLLRSPLPRYYGSDATILRLCCHDITSPLPRYYGLNVSRLRRKKGDHRAATLDSCLTHPQARNRSCLLHKRGTPSRLECLRRLFLERFHHRYRPQRGRKCTHKRRKHTFSSSCCCFSDC